MATQMTTRPPARFRRLLLTAGTAVAVAAGAPASADANEFTVGDVECVSGGRMNVYTPKYMSPTTPTNFRNPEKVYWYPVLQQWKRGASKKSKKKWRAVREAPIYYAFTSSYGFFQSPSGQAWHLNEDDDPLQRSQVRFHPFTGIRAGNYRVLHYLYWAWLDTGDQWHTYAQGRCKFV